MKTLLVIVLIFLAVMMYRAVRADEKPIEIPLTYDAVAQTVTLPVRWFRALIEAHNRQVEQIRDLKATTGCS